MLEDGFLTNSLSWVFSLIAFFVSIVVHEFAHAFIADRLGDPTPRMYKRLTLNPLRHLDPLGLLALFFIKVGWAKPVPINPQNFRKPRRDMALVAIAGPLSNIILGTLALFLYELTRTNVWGLFWYSLSFINIMLALFNMLPFAPLDGYKFLKLSIPASFAEYLRVYEELGPAFLLLFLWFFELGKYLVFATMRILWFVSVNIVRPILSFLGL